MRRPKIAVGQFNGGVCRHVAVPDRQRMIPRPECNASLRGDQNDAAALVRLPERPGRDQHRSPQHKRPRGSEALPEREREHGEGEKRQGNWSDQCCDTNDLGRPQQKNLRMHRRRFLHSLPVASIDEEE